jgi:hypothetical protein
MIKYDKFKLNKNLLLFLFSRLFSRNVNAHLVVHQCSAEYILGNTATRLHGVHRYNFTFIFRSICLYFLNFFLDVDKVSEIITDPSSK